MRIVEGTVSAIVGRMATVDVVITEGGCGRCHEVGGCGSRNLARALCGKTRSIDVANSLDAEVGDRVAVGIENDSISAVATRIYVAPLIGILIGAALGEMLFAGQGSLGGISGALTGFAAALGYVKLKPSRKTTSPQLVEHWPPPLDGGR